MSEARAVWMDLPREEHEFQFNPQRAFPNFNDAQEKRTAANAKARSSLAPHLDLPYGEHKLRRLDIFTAMSAEKASPVHVFVHGGYWRAQDKENFAFVATELAPRGITTVVINYELCPSSTLDLVADSALAAIEWVNRHVAEYGGDPRRISLLGHSAGAHLCAVGLAADWRARGIDPSFIRGTVLVSGIFDPAPVMNTTVNADLHLTPEIVARHDVERRVITVDCPVSILAGGLEPWMWIDQSFRYSHHLRRQGRDPEVLVQPGYTHFDIIDQYLDAESPLLRAVLRMAAR
jgi:arylformamidase